MFACADTNNCQDQACITNCLNTGTADAQQQVSALAACLNSQCGTCADTDATCLNNCAAENCGSQLQACFPEPAPGTGTGTNPGGFVDMKNFRSVSRLQSVERFRGPSLNILQPKALRGMKSVSLKK